ncbi:hypothetical protein F2Q68_00031115 [Brassica cretica]|uniref:Uncharacterized protein n=1 Tax=Brassica cretica TaxID=69181 RepID=A0A8S9G5S9_BRACR|nr:hypothetical protein F2Q68_00031115 [Brassica cretica]
MAWAQLYEQCGSVFIRCSVGLDRRKRFGDGNEHIHAESMTRNLNDKESKGFQKNSDLTTKRSEIWCRLANQEKAVGIWVQISSETGRK